MAIIEPKYARDENGEILKNENGANIIDETARETYVRLVTNRMNGDESGKGGLIHKIRLMGNLSTIKDDDGPGFQTEDVEALFARIRQEVDTAEQRFAQALGESTGEAVDLFTP